ncbi:MAG TPA: hypothetical protein VGQ25_00160 [Gemmatimonadales bacterium]|jgi:hypothetical protein|nr:hypothetical protein [Gemmatimonadales bacterium]
MYFARLQADVDTKLRRGAWYRVLQMGELEAVIEVNRKPVKVLKAVLEIQRRPPLRWTVVPKPGRSKSGEVQLGPTYGVCPNCRTRAPLKPKAREMDCPHCKGSFAVAWEEGYLK